MQTINKFEYCRELKKLLETRQIVGRSGKVFNKLGALSTENNLQVLRKIALELKAESTLEIGLAFGASCLTLAATHRDLSQVPNQQHVAIDPYQSTVWDDSGKLILEKANLSNYVDVREGFSHVVLPQLLQEARKFDLIYIDGSHLFENVFIDFYYSDKLLKKQGVILFDDSSDSHVRKVTNFIETNFQNIYERFDLSRFRTKLDKWKLNLAVLLKKNQLNAYRKIEHSERPWNVKFKNF